jgi:hypothetical protein
MNSVISYLEGTGSRENAGKTQQVSEAVNN